MNLLDALSGIGTVLDTPGAMLRTGLAGENPFAAVFDTDKRVSGRDLLERYGLAGANEDQGWMPDMGDLGGFAAEMLLDPTNLIGGGLLKRLIGSAGKAKAANRGIEAANALSQQQRARGFMPEEVAKLTKIVDETGQPKKMYHGTPHVFDKFDPSKLDPDALYGPGYYTTDSTVIAGGYTNKGAVYENMKLKVPENEFRKTLEHIYSSTPDDVIYEQLAKRGDGSLTNAKDARQYLLDSLRDMPNGELIHESGVLHHLGVDASQWIEPGGYIDVAPNVKMHFIDSRKPLNMANDVPFDDLPPILHNAARSDARHAVREAIREAKFRKETLGEYANDAVEALDAGDTPDLTLRLRGVARNDKMFRDAKATIARRFPERNVGGPIGGEDAYEYLLSQMGNKPAITSKLKDAGFDAIRHRGGRDTHNVTITFDPKNVYLPYIAKELQELQQTASPNSLLASLAGYNALTRPKYGGGAE